MTTHPLTVGSLLWLTAFAQFSCGGCGIAPGAECQGHTDCRADELCVESLCRSVCNSGSDCSGHEQCLHGICAPASPQDDGGNPFADAAQLDSAAPDTQPLDISSSDRTGLDRGGPDSNLSDREVSDLSIGDASAADLLTADSTALDQHSSDSNAADLARPDQLASDSAAAGDAATPADAATVTDGASAADTASAPDTASAADSAVVAVSHFTLRGIRAQSVLGVAESVAVEARDSSGAVLRSYRGTVHFTSTDPAANLPADYTFGANDAGVRLSDGVVFGTTGTHAVAAGDAAALGSQTGIEVFAATGGFLIWSVDGSQPLERLGESVATAGDFDDDGHADLILGAPEYTGAAGAKCGKCYVYSGANRSLLFSREGERADDRLGDNVASAWDYNNDGHDDALVGAKYFDGATPGSSVGKVYVHSGANGSVLLARQGEAPGDLGHSAYGLGDFNDDGYDDVVAGAANFAGAAGVNSGKVYVFSGEDNGVLFAREGEAAGDLFGHCVSGAGDFDSDGHDDIAIGSRVHDGAAGVDAGKVYVYSGATGLEIFSMEGEHAGDRFGGSVANAGDFNADGRADLVVGAYFYDGERGKVYVYSGADHSLLWSREGENASDLFGDTVALAGDYNGDGVDDLVVGAETFGNGAGKIYVYSGITGVLLFEQSGEVAGDIFSHSVGSAGDVDADGRDEIVVGAAYHDGGRGKVYLYGLTP